MKRITDKLESINPEQYFFIGNPKKTAVVILLTKIEGEINFILQKRSKHIPQGGEVCFPGGHYDSKKDKSMKDTAIRETIEEMGISKKDITYIKKFGLFFFPIKSPITVFIAYIDDFTKISANKEEVQYIFTIPLSYFENTEPRKFSSILKAHPYLKDEVGKKEILLPAKELNLPKKYNKSWGKNRMEILLYNYKNEIIWGITARIILEFILQI